MKPSPVKIDLEGMPDSFDQTFYVGAMRSPMPIDCTNGVAFLIFTSEEGAEELQIACLDKVPPHFSRYTKCRDRLKVALKSKIDGHGHKFYVAKIRFNGYIYCADDDGASFLVFNSREGDEKLEIVAPVVYNSDTYSDQEVESEHSLSLS